MLGVNTLYMLFRVFELFVYIVGRTEVFGGSIRPLVKHNPAVSAS